jgi:hypothetical protein
MEVKSPKNINNAHDIKNDDYNINCLNNISCIIKKFLTTIKQIIFNLDNIKSTLNKQIISSYYLLKEIKVEKKFEMKFYQLNNRIGMLNDSQKLLNENIKLIHDKINNFSNDIKKSFKTIKNKSNLNNNNNLNIEIINDNYKYLESINICDDNKNKSNKNQNLWLTGDINSCNSGFNTINNITNITPLNRNKYYIINTYKKNEGIKDIILNSDIEQTSFINANRNRFYSTGRNNKKYFNGDSNTSNTSNSNSYKLDINNKTRNYENRRNKSFIYRKNNSQKNKMSVRKNTFSYIFDNNL